VPSAAPLSLSEARKIAYENKVQTPETEIVVSKDGVELERRVVTPGDYLFGRESDADFRIETPLFSRQHARLSVNFDEWLIEDLGSANGTFINDQPVAPNETKRIFPTQTLRLGDATVTLRRLRGSESPDVTLAPNVAALRTILPEELKERRYAVGSVVAQGGMGAILSAEDRAIRRDVAMKVMLFSGVGGEDLTRFVEEAQITGQLEHPNIVPVYELGVDEQDQPFYTMKFVRGISLRKIVELLAQGVEGTAKKYPLPVLLTIFQKVCDGLAFAHNKGVIHRDLKPENIMLGEYGEALVMDWGLAKIVGGSSQSRAAQQGPRVASSAVRSVRQDDPGSVTMTGSIMGTPQYMSPEQASGEIECLDQRTDIYALGAILYQLLTLEPPIASSSSVDDLLMDVRAGRITPPLQRVGGKKLPHLPGGRVPESLAAVAMKAMALDPAVRYPSVQAFQADIAAYQNGFATSAERAGLGKQLALLIKRHKVASAAAAVIVVLTAGFMAKVVSSERQALAHLARLKGTAPTFAQNARALIEKSAAEPATLDEALANAGHALELSPEQPDFHVLRGGILQAKLRMDDARAEFASALKLDPANAAAKANLALCEQTLRSRQADGTFDTVTLSALAAALRSQQRGAEALAVMRAFEAGAGAMLVVWQEALTKAGIKDKLSLRADGLLILNLTQTPEIQDLSGLRGIPVNRLDCSNCTKLADLGPLAGLPLRELILKYTAVTDLSPLRGMKLQQLEIPSGVSDLSPLADMPLEKLGFASTRVQDFSVLRGMPLTYLNVANHQSFTDLSLLAGRKMKSLTIYSTGVSDLTPLKDIETESLGMDGMTNADLSDLRVIPHKGLKVLTLSANPTVRDLSGLRGSQVDSLTMAKTVVTDLSPLAEMLQLKWLFVPESEVADLAPLATVNLEGINLNGCARVRSVAPLAAIKGLKVIGLPPAASDVEVLRKMPGLTAISWANMPNSALLSPRTVNVAEFWKIHDLEKQLRAAEPSGKLRPSKFPHMTARFPSVQAFGASWYAWFPLKTTWDEARQLAEGMGGHLATLTSDDEYRFAKKYLEQDQRLKKESIGWLGGTVDKPGGEWRWITGEPWKYAQWTSFRGRREPSSQPGETALCLSFSMNNAQVEGSYVGWSDANPQDTTASGFLVEWDD